MFSRHRSYTVSKKLKTIRDAEENGNRAPGHKYNIIKSCIRDWQKMKTVLSESSGSQPVSYTHLSLRQHNICCLLSCFEEEINGEQCPQKHKKTVRKILPFVHFFFLFFSAVATF